MVKILTKSYDIFLLAAFQVSRRFWKGLIIKQKTELQDLRVRAPIFHWTSYGYYGKYYLSYSEQLVLFVSLSLPKASRWILLCKASVSSALNFRNEHHEGSTGAIRGVIGHVSSNIIYRMATRAGAGDRWVVGVHRSVCATADPLSPPKQQMSFGQGDCRGVRAAL